MRITTIENARVLYDKLRAENPWLPSIEHISVDGFDISVTPGGRTSVRMDIFIDLPKELTTP